MPKKDWVEETEDADDEELKPETTLETDANVVEEDDDTLEDDW